MKSTSIISVIIVVISIALLGVTGCRSELQDGPAPSRIACIEMMKNVPVYYESFQFWDAIALQSDTDLKVTNQAWQERKGNGMASFGINSPDINYLAESEVLTQVWGDLDLPAIREHLSNAYINDTEYEKSEIWTAKPGNEPAIRGGSVHLEEGRFVWGNDYNIDDFLRVVSSEDVSMYDENAARLLDRLLPGIMTRINRESFSEGLIVSGDSVSKGTGNILRWTNAYLFESIEAAASSEVSEYFTRIDEDFENTGSEFLKRGE
ncbi:hypothetical protein ACFLXY_10860, partial [Chloroflexota bacterium]